MYLLVTLDLGQGLVATMEPVVVRSGCHNRNHNKTSYCGKVWLPQ